MKRALATLFFLAPALAFAQLLTFVTYTAVGSQSDTALRFFAPIIAKELGQPHVVQNITGASGAIGMREFKGMAADGNHIMIGSASIALAVDAGYVDFDAIELFIPLHGVSRSPVQILVPANSPVKSVKDLKALSDKKGSLQAGSFTLLNNLVSAQLDQIVGTNTEVINYTQATQAAVDTAAGRLDYTVATVGSAATAGFISSGHLRPIAVIGEVPAADFPGVKTMPEQGYAPINDFAWTALFVHKDVSQERKDKLMAAIAKAVSSADGAKYEKLLGNPTRFIKSAPEVRKVQLSELAVIKKFSKAQKTLR
jgi:tripartite-type tricarboxylate transporter receptor subunit TctC